MARRPDRPSSGSAGRPGSRTNAGGSGGFEGRSGGRSEGRGPRQGDGASGGNRFAGSPRNEGSRAEASRAENAGRSAPKSAARTPAPADTAAPRAPKAVRPLTAKPPVAKIETPGGAFWLWGRHAVEAALQNGDRQTIRLLVTPEARESLEKESVEFAGTVIPEMVERAALDSLLGATTVHQGIALLVRPLPDVGVEDVIRLAEGRQTAVVVVLDQVTDPHNVGAVLRTAAAFGAVALLVQDRHTPDESGVLAKAASGALERVTVARVSNLVRALDTLRENGFWVAGLAADGASTLAAAKLSGKVVLALGSEGEGLRRLTREHCDLIVRLPMVPGGMESLNVSVAAAIALYEVSREGLE